MNLDRILGQAFRAVTPRQFTADNGPHDTIDVFDLDAGRNLFFSFQGRRAEFEQKRVVQRFLQAVVLRNLAITAHILRNFRLVENIGEIQPARLPVVNGFLGFEHVGAADHFVQSAQTQIGP